MSVRIELSVRQKDTNNKIFVCKYKFRMILNKNLVAVGKCHAKLFYVSNKIFCTNLQVVTN